MKRNLIIILLVMFICISSLIPISSEKYEYTYAIPLEVGLEQKIADMLVVLEEYTDGEAEIRINNVIYDINGGPQIIEGNEVYFYERQGIQYLGLLSHEPVLMKHKGYVADTMPKLENTPYRYKYIITFEGTGSKVYRVKVGDAWVKFNIKKDILYMKWEDKDIEKYAKIEGGNAEVFSVKEGVLKKEYKCIFIYNDNKLFLVSQEPLDNLVGILDTEEEFILKKEKGEQNLLKVREYYIGQYVEPFGVYNGVMCESIVFGDIVNKCIKYVKIGKVCIEDGRCFIIGLDEEQKLLVEG